MKSKLHLSAFARSRTFVCFLAVLFLTASLASAQQASLPQNPTTSTPFVNGSSPSFTVTQSTSVTGVSTWDTSCGFLCSEDSSPRGIDNNLTNFAQGTIAVSGTLTYRVTDASNVYSAGNFAGFLIKNSSLVGVAILGGVTIKTYLGTQLQETSTSTSLLGVTSSAISGAYEVGIYTTKNYDRFEIVLSNPLTVITTYDLYYPVQRAYKAGPALTCNTPTALTYPTFPAIINPVRTGITGAVSVGSVNNANNAIDSDTDNYAEIAFLVAVGGSGSISVKDEITNYPAGTYAGFDIQNTSALQLNVLGGITISTYKDGGTTAEESFSGSNLISLSSSILSGNFRQKIGFVTTKEFDEVRITLNLTGASLGTTRIYGAVFQSFCAGPALVCNTPTSLIEGTGNFPVVINGPNTGITGGISVGSINNANNAIDTDPSTYAEIAFLVSAGGSGSISVKDGITNYPAGTYAGFDIQNIAALQANVLGGITISTYKDGNTTPEETFSGSSLTSLSSSLLTGNFRQKIGFLTSKAFDEVKITLTLTGASLGTTRIYGAVLQSFCAGPTLVCNTPTHLTEGVGKYPVFINGPNTGVTGITVGAVSNTEAAIDSDPATYASIQLTAGVAGSGSISFKDAITNYPAGTFAGIDINSPSIIGISLLSGLRIETFLDGVATGDSYGNGSLLGTNVPLLSGSGRQVIGFLTKFPFDEIKLTVNQTGLDVGTVQVFGPVLTRFCAGTALDCNKLTTVTNPSHPVFVNAKNTGITSTACVACTINDSGNVIDSDTTNAATIVLTTGVASSAQFAVANAIDTYPVSSFAGFDVESTTLLSAGAATTATITLYNDGVQVQTGTGNALIVGASSALLTGSNRQIVGLVATVPYDEVKITFNQLAGADLGNIKIYKAIFDKLCAGTIACNNSYFLTQPNFPAVINSQRTGVTGGVCAACKVADAWNVITASTTDHARLTVAVGVAATSSLSVEDAISTYPAGTTAGFTIRNVNSIVELDLLNSITISTYNNGVLQESKAGSSLLNLNLLNILTVGVGTQYNPSFVTTKSFDEVRISIASLAGVINEVDVYGAFVDTRSAIGGGGLTCNLVYNPDFNVTQINVPVNGNVSTNDKVPTGSTYGPTATPGGSNPAGATFSLNADGTYTFTPIATGVYTYNVPVCVPDLGCTSVPLVITVTNPGKFTNPPVANTDIASVIGAASSPASKTINVKANDAAGNSGGTLGNPTTVSTPAHGTASINGGNIVYTPTAGYYGADMFTYTICESPSTLCATATVYITVVQPNLTNTTSAADDYVSVNVGITATGNVSTNDTDAEANTQSVTPQTVSNANGTFTLLADGSFTFVPASGFSGPVHYTYTTCDNGTPSACASATLYILVNKLLLDTNPDFNITKPSVAAVGDVSTNDNVPAGTSYGTAVADAGNPNMNLPTVNSNGTYTFTSSVSGTYKFQIPVCPVGQIVGCATETLTITVLDPKVNTNPPVVNPDIASVKGSPSMPSSVTVNVKANDNTGNLGGTLGTPTIVTQPANGSASINGDGKVIYTPAAGFYGKDILTYQVCESPSGICRSANVVITVIDPSGLNTLTASDDYISTTINTTLTINSTNGVLANDNDPDGNTLTVTTQNTTITGVGTLVLAADGSYTFTPTTGYTGPASFVYQVCDGVSGCKSATLHILVRAVPDLTPSILIDASSISNGESTEVVIRIENLGGAITTGPVVFAIPKTAPQFSIAFNTSMSSANVLGGIPVSNGNTAISVVDQTTRYLFTIGVASPINSGATFDIGLVVTATGISQSTAGLSVNLASGTGGGESPSTNNSRSVGLSIN